MPSKHHSKKLNTSSFNKYYHDHQLSLDFIGLSLLFVFSYLGLLKTFITSTSAFLYLSNKSYHLVRSENTNIEDHRQLIRYWFSFGSFVAIEHFLDYVLYYFPFSSLYYLLKPVFYIWILTTEENFNKVYNIINKSLYPVVESYLDVYCVVAEKFITHIAVRWNQLKDRLCKKFHKRVAKEVTTKLNSLDSLLDETVANKKTTDNKKDKSQ